MKKRAETITRLASERDIPELKALWKTVFGDDDADIEHFFKTYFNPALTVVINGGSAIHDDGMPVSAAYILPVGDLVLPDRRYPEQDSAHKRYPVAMLYAIATLPEYRGRGYGEAVTRAAYAQAVKMGFPAVVLKPADDGLFQFYEKRTDFRTFFDASEVEYPRADLSADDYPVNESDAVQAPDGYSGVDDTAAELSVGGWYSLSPVTPAEYRRIRQGLLEGCAYIDTDERALSYQQYLCEKAGGGLYALQRDMRSGGAAAGCAGAVVGCAGAVVGCAVIEKENSAADKGEVVYIKELLLLPGCGIVDAVKAAARLMKAEKYRVRTLPDFDENRNRRFGMIASIVGCPNIPYVYSVKWYGPAFD